MSFKKLKVNNNDVNIHVDSYEKHFIGCEDEEKSEIGNQFAKM